MITFCFPFIHLYTRMHFLSLSPSPALPNITLNAHLIYAHTLFQTVCYQKGIAPSNDTTDGGFLTHSPIAAQRHRDMCNISRQQRRWTQTSTHSCVARHKTRRHTRTNPAQVQSLIKNKHVNTDGFRQQSLSESCSNWEILIKSKLWARLESLPSLLMRACCLWNVSLHKHICMQMRLCFNKDFTTCSIFSVTLWTWRLQMHKTLTI